MPAVDMTRDVPKDAPVADVTTDTHRQSTRLHAWDPAAHLRFIDPTDFRTLDRFQRSWQVVAVHLWNNLPPDIYF